MRGPGAAAMVGWTAILFLAHFTVRPFLGWRVGVDFLLVALLLVAVRSRPGIAAFVGFALGLLTDALTPVAFGAGALAMSVVGFASSWLKAAFFTENMVLTAAFLFGGKWVFDVTYLVASRRLGGGSLAAEAFLWSPLAAALTAAVGLAVLAATQPRQGARGR